MITNKLTSHGLKGLNYFLICDCPQFSWLWLSLVQFPCIIMKLADTWFIVIKVFKILENVKNKNKILDSLNQEWRYATNIASGRWVRTTNTVHYKMVHAFLQNNIMLTNWFCTCSSRNNISEDIFNYWW